MSMDPNSNHIDKDQITKKEEEEKEEELKDVPGYEDEDDDLEITTSNSNTVSTTSKEQFRVKMVKLFIIVIIVFLVIMLIGFIFSKLSRKEYSYSDVEEVMVESAKSYFSDNKSKLPSKNNSVFISDDTLSNSKYMKPLDKYLKNDSCTGKVVVKNSSNSYDYTAYLDCGSNYKTRELYKEIVKKDNIVTSGYGLYKLNNEYVYRGLYVDNYVAFKEKEDILWRIVKVTNNNEVVLIKDLATSNSYIWDERYNSSTEYDTGINVYKNSSMSTHLDKLYASKYKDKNNEDYMDYSDEELFLNKNIKSKLKKFNACVGTRTENDTSKDGSSDCSVKYETKMAMLSVYDYLNASIDPGCTTTVSPECQNYNYLVLNESYWLINGKAEDSSKVYFISSGSIDDKEASNDSHVRPVIHLNNTVMIESGKGTKAKPYIIR